MEPIPLQKTNRRHRFAILALLALLSLTALSLAAMLGLAYAQNTGGGFSLNSPASFPVDI